MKVVSKWRQRIAPKSIIRGKKKQTTVPKELIALSKKLKGKS